MSLLALGMLVAACQDGDDDAFAPSLTDFATAASEVLSVFYLETFTDTQNVIATQLREEDPRYTRQRNSWSFGKSAIPKYDSYPLAAARAEYAHAIGLTGRGQTVSVVDSGFLTTHEAFAGKALELPQSSLDVTDHGTQVASVIAGNSATMIGIAPGADLAFGSFANLAAMASATQEAARLGAVAQNNSWGYPISKINSSSFNQTFGSADGAAYLSALDTYTADGVVVFAASNNVDGTTATLMEALPLLRPALEPGWLAVISGVPGFDDDKIQSVTRISAPCHEAARWCLVADGSWTAASASSDTAYDFVIGTSFAAPQVSGALALLGEAFPDLHPHDLRLRLLASADNSFFAPDATVELASGFWHGYSDEFGHGFLDIRAALLPIGQTAVRLADGTIRSTDAPMIVTGAATGNAVAQTLSRHSVVVADSLGGGFLMPADALVATTDAPPLLDGKLEQLLGSDLAQMRVAAPPITGMVYDQAHQIMQWHDDQTGLTSTIAVPVEDSSDSAVGLSVARTFTSGNSRFSLGVAAIHDNGALLGLSSPQDQGTGTDALAVEMAMMSSLTDDTFFSIHGYAGHATSVRSTFLQDVTAISFNSLRVDFGHRNLFSKGDRMTLGLSRPTVVTGGSASINLPVSRSADGFNHDDIAFGLSPPSRQTNLNLSYQIPLGRNWETVFEGVHAVNQGHVTGRNESSALIGFKMTF
ncbi:S8 family peptidase [Yoonia sp.]|uniref:S8 family peptidase n=1 Tax=Yoonia sp. TaxID=2212373 RepID=UPI0025D75140|nr:S8 family peptidase [Yoonia sp.]